MTRRCLFALVVAALCAGCESVPEPTLIAGHVVDSTREPLPGVTVTYSPMFRDAPAVTDETGAFELEVPAAIAVKPQFKVLFDRPGFPLMSHQGTQLPEPVVLDAPRLADDDPADDDPAADDGGAAEDADDEGEPAADGPAPERGDEGDE